MAFVGGLAALTVAYAWLATGDAAGQEPIADLVVSLTAVPEPAASNSPITYTIVVSNEGDAAADTASAPIKVDDRLPSDFIVTSLSITPAGSCILPVPFDVRCEIPTLGPGESATIVVVGTLATTEDIVVENLVLVDLPISDIPELVEADNNFARVYTTVLGAAPVGGVSLDPDAGELSAGAASSGGAWGVPAAVAAAASGAVTLAAAAWLVGRQTSQNAGS